VAVVARLDKGVAMLNIERGSRRRRSIKVAGAVIATVIAAELGQGGAAVINPNGGLTWQIPSARPHDVYVHVVDQPTLNQRIEALLTTG